MSILKGDPQHELSLLDQTKKMICPVTKQECARINPVCEYRENQSTGTTLCAEWVLKQREQGRKELEESHQSNRRKD